MLPRPLFKVGIMSVLFLYIYNLILSCAIIKIILLRILSTIVYVNTSNTIKKAKIGQILDVTNNTSYILLLNQFSSDIIANR